MLKQGAVPLFGSVNFNQPIPMTTLQKWMHLKLLMMTGERLKESSLRSNRLSMMRF